MSSVIVPIVEHVSRPSILRPSSFHYSAGDFIRFRRASSPQMITGWIYKVEVFPDSTVSYYYCDGHQVGTYGVTTELDQDICTPPPHILYRLDRWWETDVFSPPCSPQGSPRVVRRHFNVGDFIGVRSQTSSYGSWDFVTGCIYKVEPESHLSAKYWYCDVDKPGVFGKTTTDNVVSPPVELEPKSVTRWWKDIDFSFTYTPPSSPESVRPQYSPIDWETDPIYLAAKAKKTPAFAAFEPVPHKKSKKAKKAVTPHPKKLEAFNEYVGWSPDGGCSHLRWGSPPPPPRTLRPRNKLTSTKAVLITEDDLACKEDMKECMRP